MPTLLDYRPSSASKSRSELRTRSQELLKREIPFVFSRKLLSERFVAEHQAVAQDVLSRAATAGVGAGADAAAQFPFGGGAWRLPELLTPAEERSLFVALNVARYRANSLRSQLNPKRPSAARVAEVDRLVAAGEALRSHLVEANVRLVVSVAGKMADTLVPFEELFSEGLLILLKAIDGFDFAKGFRFSTYATNSLQRHFFRLKKRALRKRRLGAPVDDEILTTASTGAEVELPPDDPVALMQRILKSAQGVLDQRERQIVELRFGLRGAEHTLREIAAVLRVSKERVRQVLARAVGKLQDVATNLRLDWTPREFTAPARMGA